MKNSQERAVSWACGLLGSVLISSALAQSVEPRHIVVERTDGGVKVKVGAIVRGTGPLVIMVPSLGRGATDFTDLATRLAKAGYQTAAIDPRGIGASQGSVKDPTIANFADDVFAISSHLSQQSAIYISHAFGNRMSRAIDLHHPDKVSALILMAGGSGQTTPSDSAHDILDDVFNESLSADQRLAAVKSAFFAPGNDATVWRQGWYSSVYRMQMAALAATPASFWKAAGVSVAPVLIIQSDSDIMAPPQTAEFRAKAYPGRDLEVKTIAKAGHALLPEQPQALADIIIDFLKRKAPSIDR